MRYYKLLAADEDGRLVQFTVRVDIGAGIFRVDSIDEGNTASE